ncbi:hypothetical protein GGP41_006638 [Bipolaris sorokiniana]|uniref:Zn(2)-C6 fungal-type domain-containing protein n=2 Tax=Cochliobolus sativus TaxID=45130 RepID=A0A8H5ZP53_COCSA|nr:uncharacterized protein COCSADRAFT_322361 [Bipolaris sorokiniana ND90Pr]EMD64200.1 hypothetical protein COCSADRAFT_322361 [Bipolaris sorokiniana ND90Pr]KAF5853886.1 hypothetical protein GGP41_006638 [Bipolaris sorokiniana]
MAVVTERRAKKTVSRLEHSLLLQPVQDAMPFNPSNQTPGFNHSHAAETTTTTTPSPTERTEPFQDSLTSQEPTAQPNINASKKKRSPKTKASGELRKSTSTPHMRHLALTNPGDLSPTSNKPRNKLGYHRTSVACGHCRRRKIRCLLAPDDRHGRCSNCIRLKKECNFYPVEHNADMPQSQSISTKSNSAVQPATPVSTSPRHPLSASGDAMGDFRTPFSGPPSAAQPLSYGYPMELENDPHHAPGSNGLAVQQPSYPYPPPIDTQWPPTNSFLPSSTVAESPSWRHSPSTVNSAYGSESNVSGGHTPAAMSTSSTMSYGPQDGHWGQQPSFQPPARSMSYGNIEGLPHQYPGQGLGIQNDNYRRTSPYPFPATIDTNPSTIHATTLSSSGPAPLSAPVAPNHSYYPPTWTSYDTMPSHGAPIPSSARSMSAHWFAEPGHLDRVQEEATPPVGFGQSGVPQFYSAS